LRFVLIGRLALASAAAIILSVALAATLNQLLQQPQRQQRLQKLLAMVLHTKM
jgi:hypothetical protein